MGETEFSRVERLTAKIEVLEQLVVAFSRTTVDRIAEQRVTDGGHMYPNLVGTAGLETAFDQRRILQRLQPLPMRDRPLAAAALDDRNLLAVGRGARERRINLAGSGTWCAIDDREITPVDRVRRELLC